VPQSTVPGEHTAPTQPFPTKPLPFEQQGITPNDVMDFTPELHRVARRILHKHTSGPLFTPPSEQGTIAVPGTGGGASWPGAAVHPETGVLYVPSFTLPTILRVRKAGEGRTHHGH
jgi:quinoprotein glucose dehydrogenase